MRLFVTILSLGLMLLSSPLVLAANETLTQISSGLGQVQSITNSVGGIASEINAITGSGSSTGTTTSSNSGMFNPDTVFPAWGEGGQVKGVIGSNVGALNQGNGRLIIYFIPKVVELLIWIVAPITTIMFLYAGIQFIYGGDREEEVKKSRDFFRFAVMGLTFIVLSYSFMKAAFFILV